MFYNKFKNDPVAEAVKKIMEEEQVEEGFKEMDKYLKDKEKEKGTGKFEKKKISTGTVYQKKHNPPKDDEKEDMKEELKGNQSKIDANHNGKIDGQDFAILRKKKEMKKEEVESVDEKAPPGFEGTVKAMKKHPEISKGTTPEGKKKSPFALAWYMKNKGAKSHYKADGTKKNEEVELEVQEEIDVKVRTKDTLKGQRPTNQKDDVGPGSDGKSTKVKFHGGPSNEEVEIAEAAKKKPYDKDDVAKKIGAAMDKAHDAVQKGRAERAAIRAIGNAKYGSKMKKEEVELDEAAGKITHYLPKKHIEAHKKWMDSEGFDTHTRNLPKTHPLHKTHVGITDQGHTDYSYHTDGYAQPASEYKKNVKGMKKEEVEQIDELKKTTLKSYLKKVTAPRHGSDPTHIGKLKQRMKGISGAHKRLSKPVQEEVEKIDESKRPEIDSVPFVPTDNTSSTPLDRTTKMAKIALKKVKGEMLGKPGTSE